MKYRLLGISFYVIALSLFIMPNQHILSDYYNTVSSDTFCADTSIFESSLNPVSIKIKYCSSISETEEIILSTLEKFDKVFDLYNSLSFQETARPMDFPRIIVYFLDEDGETTEWYLDYAGLTAGDEFGLGNKQILGDINVYDTIYEIYST